MKIKDVTTWQAFYTVATHLNFSRAAATLGVGVPLLSKKVNLLESELGVKLFSRSTRRVTLTGEGQSLLPQVVSVLEDLQGLESRFESQGGRISGTIRITCLPGLAHRHLIPLFIEFKKKHPLIHFDLDISDNIIDMIESQMDLAIRVQEPTGANFVYKKLATNKPIFVAAPRYIKSRSEALKKPADLMKHHLLMLSPHEEYRFEHSGQKLVEYTKGKSITCESGMFLTALAVDGGGVAVRPLWEVKGLISQGALVQVLKNFPLENYGDVYAVIPNRRFLSHRVRTFIDVLAESAKTWV